jgi:hypothetical protein
MKKFAIHTPTKKLLKAVLDHLYKSGFKIEDRKSHDCHFYDDRHCICPEDKGRVMYSSYEYYSDNGYDLVHAEVYLNICGVEFKTTTVDLNKEYSAVVDHGSRSIKVGCQSFTFEAIENLYKAIKEEA